MFNHYLEAFNVVQQPIDHICADKRIRYCDFQPHTIANFQAAVGTLHCLHNSRHRRVNRQRLFNICNLIFVKMMYIGNSMSCEAKETYRTKNNSNNQACISERTRTKQTLTFVCRNCACDGCA